MCWLSTGPCHDCCHINKRTTAILHIQKWSLILLYSKSKWSDFINKDKHLKAVVKHITNARLTGVFWELVSYGPDVAGGLRVQLVPWAPASGAFFTDGTFCNSHMTCLRRCCPPQQLSTVSESGERETVTCGCKYEDIWHFIK